MTSGTTGTVVGLTGMGLYTTSKASVYLQSLAYPITVLTLSGVLLTGADYVLHQSEYDPTENTLEAAHHENGGEGNNPGKSKLDSLQKSCPDSETGGYFNYSCRK